MAETRQNRERVPGSKDRLRLARIAFLLSLGPFVLFVSFLGVLYLLIIAGAISPASSGGGTVLESIFIFILQAIRSPASLAPLLPSLFGLIMGYRIMRRGVDRETTKTAARAVIFGFASLAVYAYLLFFTSGIGR
jgi:hypothetical protein